MDITRVADSFFGRFSMNHMILFIGHGIDEKTIKDVIATCEWSAIITTRKDSAFASWFCNDERQLKEYCSADEVFVKSLNSQVPLLIRACGNEDEEQEDIFNFLDDDLEDNYYQKASQILPQILPELVDRVNTLVVTGIETNEDWEICGKILPNILVKRGNDENNKISKGTVSFFGLPKDKNCNVYEKLKKISEIKSFDFYEFSLEEVIRAHTIDTQVYTEDYLSTSTVETDIFFREKIPVKVSQQDLLLFNNFGMLLTERSVNRIIPLGKRESKKWFPIFLENSVNTPQWYGYMPKSTFYVKREYEEALFQLTQNMLARQGSKNSRAEMIVLKGDPGSSKTITLGALAYRIYNEKNNPVIYISQEAFGGSNFDFETDELAEAMQFIDDTSSRVLIIWDSSAYHSGLERARRIVKRLRDKGRRFVFVCSSYNMSIKRDGCDDQCFQFNEKKLSFEPTSSDNARLVLRNNCYFVHADRKMQTKREIVKFWEILKDYSGISDSIISSMRSKLSENSDIFEYYYKLISLLRNNLEEGLYSEQKKVYQYVQKELSDILNGIVSNQEKKKNISPVYQAFIEAGIDPSTLGINNEELSIDEENEPNDIEDKLNEFNLCVALFSRFKLDVPYNLAYYFLSGAETNLYGPGYLSIFNLVTTGIPWLWYGKNMSGDYVFHFRNPLEADIYLQNHDFDGEKQINLLCKIIDIYGKEYHSSKCINIDFTNNLKEILRLIGPNSPHIAFRSQHKAEHQKILENLEPVIDCLFDLIDYYRIPDEDAGFANIAITFVREYYGNIWNNCHKDKNDKTFFSEEAYTDRISQLQRALFLSEKRKKDLAIKIAPLNQSKERQHLVIQQCSLEIESAQCSIRLQKLIDEYKSFCQNNEIEPDAKLLNIKFNYRTIYNQLWKVIKKQQTNGYVYNTLFHAFELMYEKGFYTDKQKMQFLSEIMEIVDVCRTLGDEITDRGSNDYDELSGRIAQIVEYGNEFEITMEDIINHRKESTSLKVTEFLSLYDEMISEGNSAAITYVCQKELKKLRSRGVLNSKEQEICENLYEFMKIKDHYECITQSSYALAMMVRVSWMKYNHTVLSGSLECQLTRLDRVAWAEINRLCSLYVRLAGDNCQPIIVLLYALSTIHVNRMSKDGYQESLKILSQLNEGMFYQPRMRTPFMICGSESDNLIGKPIQFSGMVHYVEEKQGHTKGNMKIDGFPADFNNGKGIRFDSNNLGRSFRKLERGQHINDLEIGIGYTSFSVYRADGRKEKENQI